MILSSPRSGKPPSAGSFTSLPSSKMFLGNSNARAGAEAPAEYGARCNGALPGRMRETLHPVYTCKHICMHEDASPPRIAQTRPRVCAWAPGRLAEGELQGHGDKTGTEDTADQQRRSAAHRKFPTPAVGTVSRRAVRGRLLSRGRQSAHRGYGQDTPAQHTGAGGKHTGKHIRELAIAPCARRPPGLRRSAEEIRRRTARTHTPLALSVRSPGGKRGGSDLERGCRARERHDDACPEHCCALCMHEPRTSHPRAQRNKGD